ncbi:MAG TPA: hypothetical protein ENI85_16430, partial [Deltaproteobacteria bacterium]|nr:hypothetical protein [Deltaproteobacteria bacterium]
MPDQPCDRRAITDAIRTSLERTAERARSDLEAPEDPEVGPPVPAAALAANALPEAPETTTTSINGSSRE